MNCILPRGSLNDFQWLNYIYQTINNRSRLDCNEELCPEFTKIYIRKLKPDMNILPKELYNEMLNYNDNSSWKKMV